MALILRRSQDIGVIKESFVMLKTVDPPGSESVWDEVKFESKYTAE